MNLWWQVQKTIGNNKTTMGKLIGKLLLYMNKPTLPCWNVCEYNVYFGWNKARICTLDWLILMSEYTTTLCCFLYWVLQFTKCLISLRINLRCIKHPFGLTTLKRETMRLHVQYMYALCFLENAVKLNDVTFSLSFLSVLLTRTVKWLFNLEI